MILPLCTYSYNFYHFYLLSRKYWCKYLWTAYLYGDCCPFTQSCLTVCNPKNCSTSGFPVLHHLPKLTQTHVHWVSDAIQPSHRLFPSSPPTLNLSQHQGLFQWVTHHIRWPEYWSFSICPSSEYSGLISFRIDWFDLLASPALKLESISSLALSLLCGPTLTFIHEYWKNHSFDYMNLCQQSDIFILIQYVCHTFPSKEQVSFNFMAAVTICSDFGAQENKICHCFHFPPSICH